MCVRERMVNMHMMVHARIGMCVNVCMCTCVRMYVCVSTYVMREKVYEWILYMSEWVRVCVCVRFFTDCVCMIMYVKCGVKSEITFNNTAEEVREDKSY